ncbi:diacylglycerol kinase family lipid kinase [Lacticaseibacillus pabuli]|uniref:Diacylglycerol kinase family lipid kinase n=1 Tax=Lacticaseibacillus pabuli TaxID=3025672 RepID=A0ABY7WUJ4_9LACO|nr:diacylglycerol kinase family protein [Lacticaseibacillus sp. KACC 23028]WDF82820.1 diacylglycerol kinase family lipid kinase [Lacticaseibacillus sp. KACC 23028]
MQVEFFYVIYNPVAGSGNATATWKIIAAELAKRGIPYELFESRYQRHTVQLTQQIISRGVRDGSVLLILGGDGTLNEAITGLKLSSNPKALPIAYIPAGSGNDFARGIGLSRKPIEALDQVLATTEPLHLDIGTYTEVYKNRTGYFVNNFGIGFDAAVVNAANHAMSKKVLNSFSMGTTAYIAQVAKILLKRRAFPVTVTIDGKSETIPDAYICTTTNHPYFGGGVRILPSAVPNDGELDLIVVDRPNLLGFAGQAIQSIMGRPIKNPRTRHHFRARSLEVMTDSRQFAQIDGEDWTEQRFRVQFGLTEQDFWIKSKTLHN